MISERLEELCVNLCSTIFTRKNLNISKKKKKIDIITYRNPEKQNILILKGFDILMCELFNFQFLSQSFKKDEFYFRIYEVFKQHLENFLKEKDKILESGKINSQNQQWYIENAKNSNSLKLAHSEQILMLGQNISLSEKFGNIIPD